MVVERHHHGIQSGLPRLLHHLSDEVLMAEVYTVKKTNGGNRRTYVSGDMVSVIC